MSTGIAAQDFGLLWFARAPNGWGELTGRTFPLLIDVNIVVLDHLAPAGDLALQEFFARGR